MAAPTLGQIMSALDARLATVPDLRHADYIPDQINPPQAVVAVPDIEDYRETMGRGKVVFHFKIFLFISKTVDRASQSALADYVSWVGPKSIALAVEGDRALGGLVDDCVVDSYRNFGIEEVAAYGYIGGEFDGRVASPGV